MQAAKDWSSDDLAMLGRMSISGDWRVSIQRQVRPDGVVVIDVLRQGVSKVLFAEDDHVVEAIASD